MKSASRNLSTFALVLALFAMPAAAADHLDGGNLTPPGGDPALDITDIYAFTSPTCSECTVIVMSINALTPAGTYAPFEHKRTAYVLDIDNDGDGLEDVTFVTRFGKVKRDGRQKIRVRRNEHPGSASIILRRGKSATTLIGEDPVINNGRKGVRVFGGMVDDPFFFDLPGFASLDFCASDPSADTFAGSNVTALAFEIPNALLLGDSGNIGVWGSVWNKGKQVDRMGRPGINTVLIPSNPINTAPSQKTAFNEGIPSDDADDFTGTVVDTLKLLGNDDATAQGLASVLLPDILTIDVDQPSGYLNGRTPADDVIDASLALLTGGAIASDCVDANDVPFADEFPFLGAAHLE